jgi:hypothetical protein
VVLLFWQHEENRNALVRAHQNKFKMFYKQTSKMVTDGVSTTFLGIAFKSFKETALGLAAIMD